MNCDLWRRGKKTLLYVIFNFSTCHSALLQQNEIQNKNWKKCIFLFFNSSLYLWVDDLSDFLLNTNSTITMSLLFNLWLRFMRWYKSVMEIFTFFYKYINQRAWGEKNIIKMTENECGGFFFLFFKCLFDWMRFFSVCVYIQSSFKVSFKSKGLHKASSDVRKVHAN